MTTTVQVMSQECESCGQSATDPTIWPDARDPETGIQEVGFLACAKCGQYVCGDCEHEGECCYALEFAKENS